jgi:hypothetical protein
VGLKGSLPVAVCATAEVCNRTPQDMGAGAAKVAVAFIKPNPGGGPDDASGSGSSSSSSSSRLQVLGADYPSGIFIQAGSDGRGNGYSVEVGLAT